MRGGEEICSSSDVCLCAEVSPAKRCAGAWPGRMVFAPEHCRAKDGPCPML